MVTDGFLGLLQFADGLFPAGGFAHSFGLETYAQAGLVRDRAGLEAFLAAHLEGSAGPGDAVAAAAAAQAAACDDLAGWTALDAALHATKCVREFRDASQQMGRQTARIAAALEDDPFVGAVARAVAEGRTPGHHAVVFGAVTGRGGAPVEAIAAAYLYATAALLVGAALRLVPLGQLEGQRALAAMRPRIRRLAIEAVRARPEDMWSFTPGLELAGWEHARLDLRLFRS
jgi:urease accessory protein